MMDADKMLELLRAEIRAGIEAGHLAAGIDPKVAASVASLWDGRIEVKAAN